MPEINFHFNVNMNFYTNKCVTKNAGDVSNGQPFFPSAGTKGVNAKRDGKMSFHLKYFCNFLTTEESLSYFSLSTFLNCP